VNCYIKIAVFLKNLYNFIFVIVHFYIIFSIFIILLKVVFIILLFINSKLKVFLTLKTYANMSLLMKQFKFYLLSSKIQKGNLVSGLNKI